MSTRNGKPIKPHIPHRPAAAAAVKKLFVEKLAKGLRQQLPLRRSELRAQLCTRGKKKTPSLMRSGSNAVETCARQS